MGIIKRKTAAPLETRFLGETGFLGVQFIYAHRTYRHNKKLGLSTPHRYKNIDLLPCYNILLLDCKKESVTINTEIFQTIVKMPDPLKKEILHYAEYLLEKQAKTESSQEQLEQIHGYGSWASQIVMSNDLDERLEKLMAEYEGSNGCYTTTASNRGSTRAILDIARDQLGRV